MYLLLGIMSDEQKTTERYKIRNKNTLMQDTGKSETKTNAPRRESLHVLSAWNIK